MSKPISDSVFDIGRDLQRAYDEGYKQGRYDEKVAAIGALKEHRALYCDNTPDTFSKLSYAEKSRVDELDTAIATLVNLPSAQPERDIPLDCITDEGGNAICPKCGANAEWHKYCRECGQALKWEESNE